ncbi:single-stranded DNA-binding protein [Dermatophilus congolensis]|uniref:Single-stranded DNA-binding protein n=1 Tax=Dermatophilus congolensis TaxID=1863 RepID=A0A239VAG6_9MICO|nr:single-stranded DNA-binding protein [Dermatophilus congolensis]MBO3130500.1 single-stranded DNA-binding protein [Dermatophilus congolensis]MBO3130870.1 single-stranded DNA-binding protein [Dermatophilus congolensis]MBO3134972.1 single-stranded DNA-binding protein [Dermatophilus congolensis]MBO3137211.1 single-stranded DNA-binding protein [Dermatophilus congolensis]MBO3139454.1 single-stranded DNA-binding protein [Dermatophilus congolensis]
MAGETVITLIGNLTADPELRFTPSGAAVASFTVASTPRTFDRNNNEWRDGETLFMRCSVWRDAAENVAESLEKGHRVIVTGRLQSRSWDDKETGARRTALELQVDEVAPSLRYATAKVTKTSRGGGGGFNNGGGFQGGHNGGGGFSQPSRGPVDNDPWATGGQGSGGGQQAPSGGNRGGWSNGPAYDEPPF